MDATNLCLISVVGGLRPLWFPAQGRGADHARADRPHQAVRRAVQHKPRVRHHIRR